MKRLKIAWLVPTPFESSGGHRNIFRAVRWLREFGHDVTMYVDPGPRFADAQEIERFITAHFFDVKANVVKGLEQCLLHDCDALVATHFSTCYIAREHLRAKKRFYFVQDFEPFFFPMGTEYVMAENTYRMGFYGISSGPWCSQLLRQRYGMKIEHFLFPIDRDVYRRDGPKLETQARHRVIFFARPEMPRRCYPLGLQALSIVKGRNPDVEIVLYGSNEIDSGTVPFEHTNLRALKGVADLAALYRSADVGVAFSTTNPSLVTFEMMACGCPVVDLDLNDNAVNYGGPENAMVVQPLPERIADGIERVLADGALHEKLVENGLRYVKQFPSEEEMARRIESIIVRVIAQDIDATPGQPAARPTVSTQQAVGLPPAEFSELRTRLASIEALLQDQRSFLTKLRRVPVVRLLKSLARLNERAPEAERRPALKEAATRLLLKLTLPRNGKPEV